MKIRIFTTLSLLILAFTFASITSADGIRKRVKFAKGAHSASYSYSVIRGDRDTYIAGAKAGQRMTLKITSLEKNAVFQVQTPSGSYLQGAGEVDDAMSWSGSLPEDGDYEIIVGGTRGNASYKLTVTIK